MANSSAWEVVGDLEEFKVLLSTIEDERRFIKFRAYHGSDYTEIYKATNRQRKAIEKLDTLISQIYKKALKKAEKS